MTGVFWFSNFFLLVLHFLDSNHFGVFNCHLALSCLDDLFIWKNVMTCLYDLDQWVVLITCLDDLPLRVSLRTYLNDVLTFLHDLSCQRVLVIYVTKPICSNLEQNDRHINKEPVSYLLMINRKAMFRKACKSNK